MAGISITFDTIKGIFDTTGVRFGKRQRGTSDDYVLARVTGGSGYWSPLSTDEVMAFCPEGKRFTMYVNAPTQIYCMYYGASGTYPPDSGYNRGYFFQPNSDKTTGYFNQTWFTSTAVNLGLYCQVEDIPTETGYSITGADIQLLSSINVSLRVEGVEVVEGTQLMYGQSLTAEITIPSYNLLSLGFTDGANNLEFVIASDAKTASITFTAPPSGGTWSNIYGSSEQIVSRDYTVSGSDIDRLSTLKLRMSWKSADGWQQGTVVEGTVLSPQMQLAIMVTDADYIIDSCYFGTNESSETLNFQLTETAKGGNLTFATPQGGTDAWEFIDGATHEDDTPPPPEADYLFSQTDFSQVINNSCEMFVNNVRTTSDMLPLPLFYGDFIEFRNTSNRRFYLINGITSVNFRCRNSVGGVAYLQFDFSGDSEQVASTFLNLPSGSNLIESFSLDTQLITETLANASIHKITEEQYSQIMVERFVVVPVEGGNVVEDYGKYIINCIALPFELTPEYLGEPDNVRLANYSTDVVAPVLVTDLLMIDLGEITVPNKFGNALDFRNTVCKLHLPRVPAILVETEYVVGQTVNIKYLIDVHSGMTNVLISSSKTGELIHSETVDIRISVPTANTFDFKTLNVDVGGADLVTAPFIEVVRLDTGLSEGVFSALIPDEGTLSGYTGYVTVSRVELVTEALTNEVMNIKNILAQGVFIK